MTVIKFTKEGLVFGSITLRYLEEENVNMQLSSYHPAPFPFHETHYDMYLNMSDYITKLIGLGYRVYVESET